MKYITIFNFVIFDADAGEMNLGYFATKQLAIAKKKAVEKEYGKKLDNDEYDFRKIKVWTEKATQN